MTSGLPSRFRSPVIQMLREILSEGRSVTFIVRSSSMAPTLKDGDHVRVVPVDLEELQPGDLVAYVGGDNHVVTHRVVSLDGDILIRRGDNRSQDDPPVLIDRVLGKVERWTSDRSE